MKMFKLSVILFFAVFGDIPCEAGHISDISYPVFEYNYCSVLHNGKKVNGECKSFKNCPAAIHLWKKDGVYPTTCWYEGFDHIVCCPNKVSPSYLPPLFNFHANREPSVTQSTTIQTSSPTRLITTDSPNTSAEPSVIINPTTEVLFNFNDIVLWGQNNETCEIPGSTVNGTCTNYLECPSAVAAWNENRTNPVICTDYFVCCLDIGLPSRFANRKPRRNEDECNFYYGPRLGLRSVAIGSPAGPNEFPYMVALGWLEADNSTSFPCGGVLITSTFVLTAAHCTTSRSEKPSLVRVGGHNLTDVYIEEEKIGEIFDHPMYNSETRTNDIALIRLNWRVQKTPACLWNENALERNNVTAIGYGNTRFAGPSSEQLIKAALLRVPISECQQFYDETLKGSHLCAGMSKNDTCQGDSGGPLLMYENSTFYPYVVGITSFGNPCGGNTPGVYTRVSEYIDWIEGIIWKPVTTDSV